MWPKKRKQSDFDAEIEAHIRHEADCLVRDGIPPEQALSQARRRFGNPTFVAERFYESQRWDWLEQTLQDVRYGIRTLAHAPSFTLASVITLTIGIGANTAVFSLVEATLLRPFPYREPEKLMALYERRASKPGDRVLDNVAPANFSDLRSQAASLQDAAAHHPTGEALIGGDFAEQIPGRLVSGNLFQLLGTNALLGRTILPRDDDPARPKVVLLSHDLWRARFQSDPKLIGRTITLDGQPHEVTGVMPGGFRVPGVPIGRDRYWKPLRYNSRDWQQRSNHYLIAIGRLRPDAEPRLLQAQVDVLSKKLAVDYPNTNSDIQLAAEPLREAVVGPQRRTLQVLAGGVLLLLVIACVNVGGLGLARWTARRREWAIRSSLGAGSWRLVRQQLLEGVLLALAGGAAATALCVIGVSAAGRVLPDSVLPAGELHVNAAVLVFGLLASIGTGLLCSFAPAVALLRSRSQESLTSSSRSATVSARELRARAVLIGTQAALVVVLLTGAGLLFHSFWRMWADGSGFEYDRVASIRFSLPSAYSARNDRLQFFSRILERMRSLPGVDAAGLTSILPLTAEGGSSWFTREARPAPDPMDLIANNRVVSPGYFEALRIPLLKGRVIDSRDQEQAPLVAIINDNMARRFWPGEDPIGKRFKFGGVDSAKPWIAIVGIVGDIRQDGLGKVPQPEIYRPYTQETQRWLTPRALVVRVSGDTGHALDTVRTEFRSLDRQVALYEAVSLSDLAGRSVAMQRVYLLLISSFAIIGLILAAVGIYGTVAYSVVRRLKELAIRLALGQQQSELLLGAVRKATAPVLIGTIAGLLIAPLITRLMVSMFYGTRPIEPAVFLAVAALILLTAILSAYLPSRRAADLEPMTILRQD